ncbi:3-deoxy-7-phosphoheptulonate synthase [Streptomyces wedmorensis]|uniref:3-deoxy-7-phosphoheptulonate synthase n=1 Tax=Streptomyces wedmorensis TaxID=43759 RepID=UPI0037B0DFDA
MTHTTGIGPDGSEARRPAAMPPPVPAAGCALLRRRTASVARGEAVLLLGGSRAEPLHALTEDGMRQRRRTLLQMEMLLAHATALPVVKVGWTVGACAPPPGREARAPRQEYESSVAALNLLRALTAAPAPGLRRIHAWNEDHAAASDTGARHEGLLAEIGRSLDFLRAYGLDRSGVGAPPEFFVGHESLLLDYERALTVAEPHPEAGHDVPYATTGHLLWLGESHEPGGDHAGHLSSVHNPVAVRLGPGTCPDTVLAAVDRLDPHRAPGRLTLVAAMGADRVRDLLPAVVEKVRAEGASVCWVSDPVRANTTREEVRDEVRGFVEVHRSSGSHPGGVHVDPAAASGGGPATGGPDRGPALDVAFHFAEACGGARRDPRQEGRRADPRDASVRPGW